MNIIRILTVLVVFGVPAIVGGGLVYAASGHNWYITFLYEGLLYAGALVFVFKTWGGKKQIENTQH